MDLSDIIPAILEGGPLVIALGVAGVVIWALIRVIQALQSIIESNENQDDKRQEAADLAEANEVLANMATAQWAEIQMLLEIRNRLWPELEAGGEWEK